MLAIDKIRAYFNDSKELWAAVKNLERPYYPLGDIVFQPIQDDDREPWDFSGDQRVVQLCETHSWDVFPAFWVGSYNGWEANLDQFPIYLLDLMQDHEALRPVGNFRTYLTLVLWQFLLTNPTEALARIAMVKLAALNAFAVGMYWKGPYIPLVLSDDEAAGPPVPNTAVEAEHTASSSSALSPMPAIDRIRAFFSDSADLWAAVKDLEDPQYPVGDLSLEPMRDAGSEPWGRKEDQRVVQLFDTGLWNYFPAFWVGTNEEWDLELDRIPLYVLDEDDGPVPPVGNFRAYLTLVLERFLDTGPEEALATAARAKLEALKAFPEDTFAYGLYTDTWACPYLDAAEVQSTPPGRMAGIIALSSVPGPAASSAAVSLLTSSSSKAYHCLVGVGGRQDEGEDFFDDQPDETDSWAAA
eukprot:EG_transcript_5226